MAMVFTQALTEMSTVVAYFLRVKAEGRRGGIIVIVSKELTLPLAHMSSTY